MKNLRCSKFSLFILSAAATAFIIAVTNQIEILQMKSSGTSHDFDAQTGQHTHHLADAATFKTSNNPLPDEFYEYKNYNLVKHIKYSTKPINNNETEALALRSDISTVVLHAGPHKTGSTSIQNFLLNNYQLLRKEGYRVGYVNTIFCMLLKRNSLEHPEYMVNLDRLDCGNHRQELLIRHMLSQGENIVFSVEDLASNALYKTVLQNLFPRNNNKVSSIKVVVVYRRFFEWLVSYYTQYFKLLKKNYYLIDWWDSQHDYDNDSNNIQIKNSSKTNTTTASTAYSSLRKIPVPTFSEFLSSRPTYDDLKPYQDYFRNGWAMHPVERAVELYSSSSSNSSDVFTVDAVHVLNMHQDDELVTNFVCQMLPGTKRTCSKLQRKRIALNYRGSMFVPDIQLLVDEAYRSKILHVDFSGDRFCLNKLAVRRNTMNITSVTFSDYPQKCITKEQEEWLLDISLAFEQRILPDFFNTTNGEYQLRAEFQKYVRDKKFCNINAEAVIRDNIQGWKTWFSEVREC